MKRVSLKRIVLLALAGILVPAGAFALAAGYASPGKPAGLVSDFAHVFSKADAQALDSRLSAFRSSTGAEIAVVVVPSLGGDSIEDYAVRLFGEWGIGRKGVDDGALILVSTGDREARIEVGYGLEGAITDIQSDRIIRDDMVPEFKKGDYAAGVSAGADAVMSLVSADAASAAADLPPASDSGEQIPSDEGPDLLPFLFLCIIVLNVLAKILGSTKSWWLGGAIGAAAGSVIGIIYGFFFAGIAAIAVLTVLGLIFDYLVSKGGPSSGGGMGGLWFIGSGGGWGGGSSGFSGGFGGFGGGSSGGGGASGRW